MKIRYFGHSALEFTIQEVRILIDPFITGNSFAESRISVKDLAPDLILVTHAHGDHWGDTLQIARQSGAVVVGNFEITEYAKRCGHDRVQAMNTGGSMAFPWGTLMQTYARHSSSFPDGSYGGNPNGYVLHSQGNCVYVLGDTSPFAEMEWIGDDHDVDVAFVPIGDRFTMGPTSSLRAIRMIRPSIAIPVHYNTFPEIEVDVVEWKRLVDSEGFVAKIVSPGDAVEL